MVDDDDEDDEASLLEGVVELVTPSLDGAEASVLATSFFSVFFSVSVPSATPFLGSLSLSE